MKNSNSPANNVAKKKNGPSAAVASPNVVASSPVTGPGGAGNGGGGNVWKARQEQQQQQQQQQQQTQHLKKNSNVMHDRLLYLITNLVGLTVRVRVNDGSEYEGICHGAAVEGDFGISLKMATLVDPKTGKANLNLETVIPSLVINGQDFYSLEATDVDITFADRGVLSDAQGFQTDTGISGAAVQAGEERKLEKWMPDVQDSGMGGLDDVTGGAGGNKWDQFAANERLFGIKTEFKEEMYTTQLDKSSAEYRKREKEAERLALMIEKSAVPSNNVHLAEERGQFAVDDSQMDEEDRYGAVVRSPSAYHPPQVRNKATVAAPADSKAAPSPKVTPAVPAPVPKQSPAASPVAAAPAAESKKTTATTLNPNAASFKFNLKAAEFKPSGSTTFTPQSALSPASSTAALVSAPISAGTSSPVTIAPAPANIERDNIFGRRLRVNLSDRSAVKAAMFRNFSIVAPVKDKSHWRTGQQTFKDLAEESAAVPIMPVAAAMPSPMVAAAPMYAAPMPYGYQQAPVAAYPSAAVAMQQQQQQFMAAAASQQFYANAAAPAFIPAGQMPMQYGYQQVMYMQPPHQQQQQQLQQQQQSGSPNQYANNLNNKKKG